MPLGDIPFVLSLEDSPLYNHNIFPNNIYRRQHSRHHTALDMHTLGLLAGLAPHARHLTAAKHGLVGVTPPSYGNDKYAFEVNLDVGLFQPEELTVKVIKDSVVVEGKHEERQDDHGHISRHFIRRYPLPEHYDLAALVSTLSTDGVLTVRLPKPKTDEVEEERIITIQQIGPSDLFLKNGSPNSTVKEGVKIETV